MFGYVTASRKELDEAQQLRYSSVYCGICRQIALRASQISRVGLSNDMVFLALLLMSLYEPQEESGELKCMLHPFKKRSWADNEYIRYAADMNVLLSYYNFLDNWQDDKNLPSRLLCRAMEPCCARIGAEYPRQHGAIRACLSRLSELEGENCPDPDAPAGVFGELMAELFVYREDLWSPALRAMGASLGRFIYLSDAAQDYDRDKKKNKYNPYIARGDSKDPRRWREYQLLTMARCTDAYERLPLVQDKGLMDNILYSGVWLQQGMGRKEGSNT